MLKTFGCVDSKLVPVPPPFDAGSVPNVAWVDAFEPTGEESRLIESLTGLHVSSREELSEIEASSRLSLENGVLYLSMTQLVKPDDGPARSGPLGFVLSKARLVTIRFDQSRLFDTFPDKMHRDRALGAGPAHVFVGLLEAMVDRLADLLENIRAELDQISSRIFGDGADRFQPKREDVELRATLKRIGRIGDLTSRIRDSLLGIARIVPYVAQMASDWLPADLKPRFKTLRGDIGSLTDYDAFIANKIQFLMDAVLGFINIAQNNIIKVLTVVSVAGVPPTLVASIYGMNFKSMPELDWAWGYPYALGLIVVSAIAPLLWFVRRGWL
ncbi:MAG: magnesium transporter CorA family protein [Acetobacteraceae bacterium]|nr:magnesium transporter CorA family protein [Acetobacteraceae bacterium]